MAAARSGYSRIKSDNSYGAINAADDVTYVKGSSVEFFQICDRITTNLFTLNKAATTLERKVKQLETPNDSQVLRERITQVNSDAGGTVGETTDLLRTIHSLTLGDKQRRIRAHKLQTEFQASATRFSEIQRRVVVGIRKARLPVDRVALDLDNENTANAMENEGEQKLKQMQEIKSMELEVALQEEKEHQVRELESDIVNINEIMRELSSMVAHQGDFVDSIENNVDSAHGQVEEARQELIKAAAYQSKSRKRTCWCILILIIVLAIIAIVLALHYSSN